MLCRLCGELYFLEFLVFLWIIFFRGVGGWLVFICFCFVFLGFVWGVGCLLWELVFLGIEVL